jgi:4-hydroxy-tetrahydrodipicolinate synthase
LAALLRGGGPALDPPLTSVGAGSPRAGPAPIDWQLSEGIDFVVPCGSTGEAVTMTPLEHRRVVEITVEQVKGRVPVVAGAGSNDTAKAVAMSKEMKAAGATHLLHVSPMYNKPPQRGIIAHFERIADATDLPIIVYNVPGRTGSNIEAKTTLALAKLPHVAAVKEASGNLGQITDILKDRPATLSVLSGDDEMTLAVMGAGGDGVISVVSNATPKKMTQLCAAAAKKDWERAKALHFELLPWMRAAFIESNPLPVKAGMAMLGKMQNNLRLPLVPLDEKHAETVRAALKSAGALH